VPWRSLPWQPRRTTRVRGQRTPFSCLLFRQTSRRRRKHGLLELDVAAAAERRFGGSRQLQHGAVALAAIQELSYARAGASLRSSWPPESAMDAAALSAFLSRKDYAVLATTTPDGRPQAAPVAFFVQGGSFWVATVAGPRLRNLRAAPHASLVVAEGDRGDHRAVRVEGRVRLHDGSELEPLRRAWQERHGSDPSWAAAFVELRPGLLFSYAGG